MLMEKLNCKTENILVGIGPGIRACHFEIKEDTLHNYKKYPEFILQKEDRLFVNLAGIIQQQILTMGIQKENIEDSMLCTFCLEEKYFSYRRDKPENVEAMLAYIGLKFDRK
jgi:polyphenol oxidase